jgi:hypothetical protein
MFGLAPEEGAVDAAAANSSKQRGMLFAFHEACNRTKQKQSSKTETGN